MNEMSYLGRIKTDLTGARYVHLQWVGGAVTLCGEPLSGNIRATPGRRFALNDWICPKCSRVETILIQLRPATVMKEAAE